MAELVAENKFMEIGWEKITGCTELSAVFASRASTFSRRFWCGCLNRSGTHSDSDVQQLSEGRFRLQSGRCLCMLASRQI